MSRNQKKGFFFKSNLIKKKKHIKLFNKNLTILPEYINYIFYVHNGKTFTKLKITDKLIGYKFGEFINTRKKFSFKKK